MKALAPLVRTSRTGFTMVELLVTVSILGVAGTLAVPNALRWQAKARQAEARIALSAIYARERTYRVENLTYSACLTQLGFQATPGNYYAAGFTGQLGNTCGKNSNQSCYTHLWSPAGVPIQTCAVPAVPTNIGINGTRFSRQSGTEPVPATIDQVTGTGGATDMTRDTFIARTAGKISWIVSEYDRWTINEQQQLVNTQTGI